MEVNYSAVLLSLGVYVVKRNSAKLASAIVSHFVPGSRVAEKRLNELNVDLTRVVAERDTHNQIDEFAKYSLANRRVNKILDEMKAIKSEQSTARIKSLMYVKAFVMFLVSIMSIALIWHFYDKPLVRFTAYNVQTEATTTLSNENNIFYPLGGLLAFPQPKVINSIGVTFWLFLSNRLIDIFLLKIYS